MLILPPADLRAIMDVFHQVAHKVVTAWGRRNGPQEADMTPGETVEAMEKLFDILPRLSTELTAEADGMATQPGISELSDYVLRLIGELSGFAVRLEMPGESRQLTALGLPFSLWAARHGASFTAAEPVVDAVATVANILRDPNELSQLYEELTEITDAMDPLTRNPESQETPMDTWRILLINRAIVGTRSLDPTLMEDAFDILTTERPADAARFFEEGMAQMDLIGYPDRVREVMTRYHQRFSVVKTLH